MASPFNLCSEVHKQNIAFVESDRDSGELPHGLVRE